MIIAFCAIMIFIMVNVICSTEADMVVNMVMIYMRSNDIRVLSFKQFISQFDTNLMSLFIRNLTRSE